MTILLPKYHGIENNARIHHGFGISGEVRCKLYDLNLNLRYDTGWEHNLITDRGLELLSPLSSGAIASYTYIGSGTSTPSFSDTQMQSFLGSSNVAGVGGGIILTSVAPDYEYNTTLSRRFPAGVGTGSVNEVGLGYNSTSINGLYARQLLGSTIVKGADQVLDVIWRQTYWPLITDVLGVVTIGGIVYDTISRGSQYTPGFANSYNRVSESSLFATDWLAFDGDLGSLTGIPAGNQSSGTTFIETLPYTPGSHLIHWKIDQPLGSWTPTLGIRSVRIRTSIRAVQIQFNAQADDARRPKDGTNIIDMTFEYSWDRRP